jgi:hypothetical protein
MSTLSRPQSVRERLTRVSSSHAFRPGRESWSFSTPDTTHLLAENTWHLCGEAGRTRWLHGTPVGYAKVTVRTTPQPCRAWFKETVISR